MEFSCIPHLYCSKCDATYDDYEVQHLCACGFPLLVQYDLEMFKNLEYFSFSVQKKRLMPVDTPQIT